MNDRCSLSGKGAKERDDSKSLSQCKVTRKFISLGMASVRAAIFGAAIRYSTC